MALYRDIFRNLAGQIETEEFAAGELLPSELDLMKEYDCSRDTVRKALSLLSNGGYIEKRRGIGSVVIGVNRIEFPATGLTAFSEIAGSLGRTVETKVVDLIQAPADRQICRELQLPQGAPVWLLRRVRLIDGEAVILDTDYLNAQIVPELTVATAEKSLYAYLEGELGLKISYAEKEITCVSATRMDRQLLDMGRFDMVVTVESRTFLDDSQVFQFTSSRHRPDKFRFKQFARRKQNF